MLKVSVDVPSFFRRGIKNKKDDFMIALINGYQGSGKSFYAIYKLEKDFKGFKVYTNIKSYGGDSVGEVVHFSKISELYNNHDTHCVFVVDELSKKYTKNSPIDKDFYSWLQQSRKHHRYVFLITQEYLQVPNWLRGIATLCYTTQKIPLTPIMATSLGKPVLDPNTCEWSLDTKSIIFYKRTKKIGSLYDTYELINSL